MSVIFCGVVLEEEEGLSGRGGSFFWRKSFFWEEREEVFFWVGCGLFWWRSFWEVSFVGDRSFWERRGKKGSFGRGEGSFWERRGGFFFLGRRRVFFLSSNI